MNNFSESRSLLSRDLNKLILAYNNFSKFFLRLRHYCYQSYLELYMYVFKDHVTLPQPHNKLKRKFLSIKSKFA